MLKWVVPSFPGIANDIKKPGVEEHGYTRTPLKAAHSMIRAGKALIADLPQDHRAAADLPLGRGPRRGRRVAADHPRRVSSRDVEVEHAAESYHVATLDNDAPTIFERSAEFFARVTAPEQDCGTARRLGPWPARTIRVG